MKAKNLFGICKPMLFGVLLLSAACNNDPMDGYYTDNASGGYYDLENTEEYNDLPENPFKSAQAEPLSTFSIDVDAASYSNMRRYINNGMLPPKESVRTEEFVNYFSYNYPQPTDGKPVHISVESGQSPWNAKHRLVRIGLKAKEIPTENLPTSNLVFLIDVSGSMYGPTRLDLVKSSLMLLVNNLREEDHVSIVVYAGAAGLILPPTAGNRKEVIKDALAALTAEGSTAGAQGIKLAYATAREHFKKGGNNRVILCTDGDFNVGVSSPKELEALIEKERNSGIYLTVLGYGMGNYKDNRMQILAEKGNGNHAYIDNIEEANKVLVNEFGSTLFAAANDVKLQVEFNPAQTLAYRLVGYESRLLAHEDFNNDKKDAGDMGVGHTVTAFYEIVPVGVESDVLGDIDDLKYQDPPTGGSNELLTVKLRYKEIDSETSNMIEVPVVDANAKTASVDFNFASAVAMYAQLLRESKYVKDASFDQVISIAESALGQDEHGCRKEFTELVRKAKKLSERKR